MKRRMAFKFGCVMVRLPQTLADEVRGYATTIPSTFLKSTEDASTGIPKEFHVTVKYGIQTEDPYEVAQVIMGTKPFAITLGRTGIFHNETEVVFKLAVESFGLKELNRAVCDGLSHVNTYSEFRPHVTVAYLQKRQSDPYYYRAFYTDGFIGREFEVDRVVFSSARGGKSMISFRGDVVPMGDARVARIARRMVAFDDQNATLEDLRGGIHFSPKFIPGKAFVVALRAPSNKVDALGIYVRNPYGGETFRKIRIRDALIELGMAGEDEATIAPIQYFTGYYHILARELEKTGKFHVKRIM